MSENKEGKIHRAVITEAIGIGNLVSSITINSAIEATGSLALYEQYHAEALAAVERASNAGSMSPSDASSIKGTLEKWRDLSGKYYLQITELTKQDENEKLEQIRNEIDRQIPDQQKMIHDIHETMFGTETRNRLARLFEVDAGSKEETAFFRDKPHEGLVESLLRWIETNDKEKLFGDNIHGPREAGIDVIIQAPSGYRPRFGIQVKNNEDVKNGDFALKLKAQITDAKKHKLQGLIIFIAADMTEESVKAKVNSILSDISQMNDPSLIVIPPQRAVSLVHELMK